MITENELEKMNRDYSALFRQYGDDEKSLGWNKPKQRIRFEIFYTMMLRHKFWQGRELVRLLDIGCGLGHFSEFLAEQKLNVQYIGIDPNIEFINSCKKKFPEGLFYNSLFNGDFYDCEIVCASGVFNRKFDQSFQNIQNFFKQSQNASVKLILANFLHIGALEKYETNYYSSIAEIENIIDRTLVSGFEIDAFTLPGEFSICLIK